MKTNKKLRYEVATMKNNNITVVYKTDIKKLAVDLMRELLTSGGFDGVCVCDRKTNMAVA